MLSTGESANARGRRAPIAAIELIGGDEEVRALLAAIAGGAGRVVTQPVRAIRWVIVRREQIAQ
jgi:hypothetical protein